ncbi:MAG: beta-ketoacyl-ACP synthase [Kiritimatiellae bacterium]|nr:beta-ketoacyl-ACP synthase [Kiritimatiellia bacterium]
MENHTSVSIRSVPARRVVVTGMGAVSPLGSGVAASFERLKVFENCVAALPELAEFKGLNTHLACKTDFERPAGWTRKTTRTMGDVAMLALAATEQAVADAGLSDADLQSGRTGVAYGSCSGSIPPLLDFYSMLHTKEVAGITSGSYIKLMPQTAACNISVHFKTHGRLVPTGTACTSGSLAIGSAAELIRWGVQDVMIAGGADEFSPTQVAVFDTLYATSLKNDAPRTTPAPYDADRDGLVLGDGAATLILEEYEHAKARGATILAEIAGFAETTDGTHVTNPNAETMAYALTKALRDAGIDAAAIGYVSGHGTATKAGDVAETVATRAALGRAVPISSIKSYTGHTLGACGALEAAMAIMSLRAGWFPPTLNLRNPDPECAELNYVTGEGRTIDAEYAMSNNFAFGGVNTSLVLRRV